MKSLFFIIICLFSLTKWTGAQELVLPEEAKAFIVKGYEVLDLAKGDVNADGYADLVLILKNPAEESNMEERLPRPLLILARQADGKLKQVVRNDNAVMGRYEGGVFGDPWQGIDISPNGFTLMFYGGSSWRWSYHYEFTWNKVKKMWLLTKETSSHFHSGDMEATTKNTVITATELGEINIEKFSTASEMDESTWKVIALKTWFYDNPKLGSKPRKGYLVKGNICTVTRVLKNFVEVSFENSKGEFTTGFLLKKDLVKQK